ncbi:hypothetical protein [Antribacter gilvus]|uniref:hypothetical protein n=1 Tax=Antribacter gilvus TaxID=2304675 RepID=UPI000F777864|nr:hypothetical protein [Antribacter gilvus]
MATTLTIRDLVEARLEALSFGTLDHDLAAHHKARASAIAAAFGIDEDNPPQTWAPGTPEYETTPEWCGEPVTSAPQHLAFLSRSCERALLDLRSPFANYLEATAPIAAMAAAHGDRIAAPVAQARQAMLDLLVEVTWRRFSLHESQTVLESDLVEHGFDPKAPAPDPFDYL